MNPQTLGMSRSTRGGPCLSSRLVATVLVAGSLSGCGGAVSYVVIWPHGTEVVRDSPLTIALPDGEEHQLGDQLQVGGGESSSPTAGGIDVEAECPGAAVWLGSD